MTRLKIAHILLIMALVSFANTASAAEFMKQKELLATIPGSTLYGVSPEDGKTPWTQAYGKGRKKGKISGISGNERYNSKWFVSGDLWCEDWGSGPNCWQFVRIDAKTLHPFKNGKRQPYAWKIK